MIDSSSSKRVRIEVSIEIELNDDDGGGTNYRTPSLPDEAALKKRVWERHQIDIFEAMQVSLASRVSSERKIKLKSIESRRLLMLDHISTAQRKFMQNNDPTEAFDSLLASLLDLTESEYGFIGEFKHDDDGTMYFQPSTFTNIARNDAIRKIAEEHPNLQMRNLNCLWDHVLKHGEPVVSNNPAQDPRSLEILEGHPPVQSYLGIPFFEPGTKNVVGMLSIANTSKEGGYSHKDVEFLEPFTVTCSNLIQSYRATQANILLIDTLEEKVRGRTRELEVANDRLAKATRAALEAAEAQLKTFACMSHEIRTPLNCIVGLSSLLLESGLSPQQLDSMRMIINSGEVLTTIVSDILDYSKLVGGNVDIQMNPTDLQETLSAVVHSIEIRAKGHDLKFSTYFDPFIPKIIDTDPRRLQQILYNLLGNAIKYSAAKGKNIELRVEIVDAESPNVDPTGQKSVSESSEMNQFSLLLGSSSSLVPLNKSQSSSIQLDYSSTGSEISSSVPKMFPKGKILRFRVKDYGRGIDSADFQRIFLPFMQAREPGEKRLAENPGTGLGLAITSTIVQALGGTISVDSELGKWAEFSVDFPFHRPLAAVQQVARLLSDTRILFVNDHKNGECLPSALVQAYNLRLVEFGSCEDLLSLAKRIEDGPEGPFTDICLIHEDLYDFNACSKLCQAAPSTIVLTFGPRYLVKDSLCKGHYRSLSHFLPSAFVESLVGFRDGTRCRSDSVHKAPEELTRDYSEVKVLVVDDNVINQKVLRNMLKKAGIQDIHLVDDGKEAVDLVLEKGDFDLILMDVQMPVMDGMESTRLILLKENIRRYKKRPYVVFATANIGLGLEEQATKLGASGYISKPFNLKKIKDTLTSLDLGKAKSADNRSMLNWSKPRSTDNLALASLDWNKTKAPTVTSVSLGWNKPKSPTSTTAALDRNKPKKTVDPGETTVDNLVRATSLPAQISEKDVADAFPASVFRKTDQPNVTDEASQNDSPKHTTIPPSPTVKTNDMRKALVVDDNLINQRVLKTMLRKTGVQDIHLASGREVGRSVCFCFCLENEMAQWICGNNCFCVCL